MARQLFAHITTRFACLEHPSFLAGLFLRGYGLPRFCCVSDALEHLWAARDRDERGGSVTSASPGRVAHMAVLCPVRGGEGGVMGCVSYVAVFSSSSSSWVQVQVQAMASAFSPLSPVSAAARNCARSAACGCAYVDGGQQQCAAAEFSATQPAAPPADQIQYTQAAGGQRLSHASSR